MDPDNISDIRQDFKNITFSKFQKSQAKIELINTIYNCKIENACYWCAEFICAGHFLDLWDIIIIYFCKYIHSGNPKLPIYLSMRYNNFLTILNNGYSTNLMMMRNNKKIRKLFAEIVCIMCLSTKKLAFSNIKINKEDYNIANISFKLKAPNIEYARQVYKNEDPKELFIAVNEFAYHISKESKNLQQACYWLEWMLGYEKLCLKETKERKKAARRQMPVDNKSQLDTIWILWELILYQAKNKNSVIYKITNCLLNLFCIKYTTGCKNKRKDILYFSISLITEPINLNINIIKNENMVKQIVNKIDIIYKQIKKNEITPNTDYLFNNSFTNGNLEKTISKLDKMNQLMNKVSRMN